MLRGRVPAQTSTAIRYVAFDWFCVCVSVPGTLTWTMPPSSSTTPAVAGRNEGRIEGRCAIPIEPTAHRSEELRLPVGRERRLRADGSRRDRPVETSALEPRRCGRQTRSAHHRARAAMGGRPAAPDSSAGRRQSAPSGGGRGSRACLAFGWSSVHLQLWLRRARWALVVGACAAGCQSSPTAPQSGPLAIGRWSSAAGQCLTVTESSCNFVAGCGHGVFPRPTVSTDGSFEVDGMYRIEVGPISIQPAPPAHFSGALSGGPRLLLTVTPTAPLTPGILFDDSVRHGHFPCSVPCL